MSRSAHPAVARPLWVALILCALLTAGHAEVKLPGIAQANLEPATKGRLLLEELQCVACHRAEDGTGAKQAPRLADVAQRVNAHYLKRFILDPQAVKPGTTMPAPLAGLPAGDRAAAAEDLAQFLGSLKRSGFEIGRAHV